MKRHHHRIIAYIIIGGVAMILAVQFVNDRYNPAAPVQEVQSLPVQSLGQSFKQPAAPQATSSTTRSFLLKVPFTPQAPTANWDTVHNEDCEEASSIMTAAYFGAIDSGAHQSDVTLPPPFVEDQLTILNQWEQNHFGYYLDINSEEVAQTIQANYGLKIQIVTDYSEDYIKSQLRQNHVVLLPADGRLLGNPNFRSPGPPYHMLVIRGYDSKNFITNDPGTRKGLNYPYPFEVLYSANGDWDHATNSVDLKKKNIIVVWK